MTSRTTILLVIGFLGLIALVIVTGSIYLVATHNDVPGELWTLAGTTTGALGMVLSSSRSGLGANEKEPSTIMVPTSSVATNLGTGTGTGAPTEVTVVNTPAEPVPVDAAPENPRRP